MGCSLFGLVEGREITQEQLTAYLNNTPPLAETVRKCAHCRMAYEKPNKGLPRCGYCGSYDIVTLRNNLARTQLT